jgi:hypothetical protein
LGGEAALAGAIVLVLISFFFTFEGVATQTWFSLIWAGFLNGIVWFLFNTVAMAYLGPWFYRAPWFFIISTFWLAIICLQFVGGIAMKIRRNH